MRFHGGDCDHHRIRYLLVALTFDHKMQNFHLSLGQVIRRVLRYARRLDQHPRGFG